MTNEELQAHLEALKAAHKAGQIEEWNGCDGSAWREFDGIMMAFTSEMFHYRIKPKPREVWIEQSDIPIGDTLFLTTVYGGSPRDVFASESVAKHWRKFREVLE